MQNVLLLNMSVIQEIKEHYYLSINKKKIFCGVSSLEPGTKQVIYDLLFSNQTLDKIIIMATKETTRLDERFNEKSVCDFYQERISDFINLKEQFAFGFKDKLLNINKEQIEKIDKAFLEYFQEDAEIYKEGKNLLSKFQDINESDSSLRGILNDWIKNQCNKLLECINNDKEKIVKQNRDSTSFEFIIEEYNQIFKEHFVQDSKVYQQAKFLDDKYFRLFPKKFVCIFQNHNKLVEQYNLLRKNHIRQKRENEKWKQKGEKLYERAKNIVKKEQERIKNSKDMEKSFSVNKRENELVRDYIYFKIVKFLFFDEEFYSLKEIVNNSKEIWEEQRKKIAQNNFFELVSFYDNENKKDKSSKEVLKEVFNILNGVVEMDEKKEVDLYIDTQGGNRNTQQILNSAVEMLQLQTNIHVKQSVGTEFNRSDIIHQVRDVSEANKMFEMVSGMYEFINYGRAKTLSDYFASEEDKKSVESAMVEAMENFSCVLAVCSVNSFFPALKKLKNAINNCKKKSTDPLFSYFIRYIEKEYEELLQAVNERNEDSLIQKEIRWCVDKKMYMQAITLIEAKMPEYFIKNGIFFYAKNDQEVNKAKMELQELKSDSSRSGLYKFDDVFHYIIKYYIHDQLFKNGLYISWNKDSSKVVNISKNQSENQKTTRKKHWYLISDLMEKHIDGLKIYSNYTNKERRTESGRLIEETKDAKYGLLNIIYNEYIQLSNIRNGLNHADNVNSSEWLAQYLRQFLEDIDQLLEYNKKDTDWCKPKYIKNDL